LSRNPWERLLACERQSHLREMAMKCPHCGTENLDSAVFCTSCGREMSFTRKRNCVSCGRSISWDANVCPYCGKDYRYQTLPGRHELVSPGMRAIFYVVSIIFPIAGFIIGAIYYTKPEEEYKHVGKMCIVFATVAIVVEMGLGALLYVLVLGFSGYGDGYSTPGINVLRKSSITGGFKIEFTAPTSEVSWSDVTILLSDTFHTLSWTNLTSEDLTSVSPPAVWHYGRGMDLNGLDVFLNVTDLASNGRMSNGDYITLTVGGGTFSTGTTYSLTLLYKPTDGSMISYVFTG
jgi:RNA polymerase subunit RPABC4/transcription elongation factor Spt4